MADERVILQADLLGIERALGQISGGIQVVDDDIGRVDNRVAAVNSEVSKLAKEFHDYIMAQVLVQRKAEAQTRLIQIDQELEKKFGHYDVVRRSATGILQATDLGLVRRAAITNAAENIMIETPGYWLAPCLVALAAWINDQPELAEKAVREGLHRDDAKTSLFFGLIARRAGRGEASLKWLQRYLENQDEENLDRKTVIVLDAYASGLLGADSEGVISQTIGEWLEHLADKPGFVENQRDQWAKAINSKRKNSISGDYTYLSKYSENWPALLDVMEGAELHAAILDYFVKIFMQESSTETLKAQMDEILMDLVTGFDSEETPLQKEKKFEQLVVQFGGDEQRARMNMEVEEKAFEESKDFTQLLTDAAMNPEISHASPSTQKFAIALTKEWIMEAYRDLIAKNRAAVPQTIKLTIGNYQNTTYDGSNEQAVSQDFVNFLDKEKQGILAQYMMSAFDNFCLYGGGVIAVVGLLMMLFGNKFLGVIAIVAGAGLVIRYFSRKKTISAQRESIENQYRQRQEEGLGIIRAFMAETVDFRSEFAAKDGQAEDVLDFLEQISPDQYVRKLSQAGRRVRGVS